MNFIGRHYHALEQKGRIAIPAPYRKDLGAQAVITRGLEGCLFLFPESVWQKTIAGITVNPFTDADTRQWTRLLAHHAQPADYDAQGRVLIQEHLRDFAHLTSDCVIAGSIEYLEIWDKTKYHQHMDQLESQAESIAQRVSQKGNHA